MNLKRDWYDLWYKSVPTGPIGLLRMLLGFLILVGALQLWPDRVAWFGERGLLPTSVALQYNQAYTDGPRLITFLYGASDTVITVFLVAFIAAAFLMTIGLWTRPAIFFVWLGLNAIHNRNMVVNTNGGDQIQLIFTAYLFMARADGAFSVSRLLRIRATNRALAAPPTSVTSTPTAITKVWAFLNPKPNEGQVAPSMAIWPQRLMQLQMAVVYLSTFLHKANGDPWQHGTATYYPYAVQEFHRFPMPLLNANHLWFIQLSTYSTLGIELALGTLVFVPRLRLYVLLSGVLLHLGIEYSLNIPLFGFLMIATYCSFLKQTDLNNFAVWLRKFRITVPMAVDLVKVEGVAPASTTTVVSAGKPR